MIFVFLFLTSLSMITFSSHVAANGIISFFFMTEFPVGSLVKISPVSSGDGVQFLVQEDPLEMEMQPTLVFLPRKSMDRGDLGGYSL